MLYGKFGKPTHIERLMRLLDDTAFCGTTQTVDDVKYSTQIRDVAGTLFADNRPRIVQVKGINLEAELAAHMLYITNEDKPGLIGSLGTLLGDSGINVATFHLGRSEPGGDAIALLGVDQPIDEAVLTAVRALPHVAQAQALNF